MQPDSSEDAALPIVDSVHNYEKIHRIGEGTYGVVCEWRGGRQRAPPGRQGALHRPARSRPAADKARDLRSGEVVALKKVRFDVSRDGVPVTSLREIRVLQSCQHPNIVQLNKVVTGSKPDRCAGGRPAPDPASCPASAPAALAAAAPRGGSRGALGARACAGACLLLLELHPCCRSSAACSWCSSTATTTWPASWTPCPSPSQSRRSRGCCCR